MQCASVSAFVRVATVVRLILAAFENFTAKPFAQNQA